MVVILSRFGPGSPPQSLSVDPGSTLTRGRGVGEEASRARPRDPEGERAHTRDEAALPVAVPAVPGRLTEPVRLGRHRLVHDRLGELPGLPPACSRTRLRGARWQAPSPAPSRLLCRSLRSLPFTRTCLVVIQILGNGRSSFLEASPGLTPAFPTRSFRGLSPSSARDRYTNFLDTSKVRKNLDGTEAEQKMSQHCTSVCAYEWRLQKESP